LLVVCGCYGSDAQDPCLSGSNAWWHQHREWERTAKLWPDARACPVDIDLMRPIIIFTPWNLSGNEQTLGDSALGDFEQRVQSYVWLSADHLVTVEIWRTRFKMMTRGDIQWLDTGVVRSVTPDRHIRSPQGKQQWEPNGSIIWGHL
jgi:hypothetical protein